MRQEQYDLDTLLERIGLHDEAIKIVRNYPMSECEYKELRKLFRTNTGLLIQKISARHDFRQCFLYLYCRLAVEAYEQYRLKNIEDEVYFDTFRDITIWCENCFRYFGEYGINEYRWLVNHVKLGIFRLGRLQFQPVYKTDDNSRQGEDRIFGGLKDSPELYPEVTTLQKRAKEYLISGKKIGMGSGIIFSKF